MRVWLVDNKRGEEAGSLESLLYQLQARPGSGVRVIGASPYQTDFTGAMRKLVPELLDLIVINERVWPDDAWSPELLGLGMGIVLVANADRADRVRTLADQHPMWFAPAGVNAEGLWLALLSAMSGQRRQAEWKGQLARLQQRLNDRILVERAKGVLVQRLGISEDDAYKRLRVLSRRQRRQIRDIAQSLLDTQCLFVPDSNGIASLGVPTDAKATVGEIRERGLVTPEL